MRNIKKSLIVISAFIIGLPLVLMAISFAIGVYLYVTADFLQPHSIVIDENSYNISFGKDSVRVCNGSSLLLNEHGLWEAHISGTPSDRGIKYGLLCRDLLSKQEDAFVNQIHEMIPSDWWVEFLHKLILIFIISYNSAWNNELRNPLYIYS